MRLDFVRPFVDNNGAKVVQERHQIRQYDWFAGAIDLASQVESARFERSMQKHVEVLGAEFFETLDVMHGRLGEHILSITGIEGCSIAVQPFKPAFFAVRFDERRPQKVSPGTGALYKPGLDRSGVRQFMARSRIGIDHHVDPSEGSLGDLSRETNRGALIRVHQDLLDLQPDIGAMTISGHKDQARQEPPIELATDKQADLAAVAQVKHGQRHRFERLDVDLE